MLHICIYIYSTLDAIVGWVESSLWYSMNARAFGPQTPYQAVGSAGVAMRTGKQLFVKSYDLSFQSITVVISTYVCLYWMKGILCGYAIRSGNRVRVIGVRITWRIYNVYSNLKVVIALIHDSNGMNSISLHLQTVAAREVWYKRSTLQILSWETKGKIVV